MEARAGMLLGSILAGMAFSHSDVASVHCIAEALGSIYDAPHGLCNAVVLPAVMEYNLDYCNERYSSIASAMGQMFQSNEDGAHAAIEAVRKLASDIGLPDFKTIGVREDDFEKIASSCAANGSNKSNPRPMNKEDYLRLLDRLSGRA
jgi:alcohol dehydrogenase